jgi:hypothetical protein
VAIALLLFSLMATASGTPALSEPLQDGEFCNRLKVTGTGTFEMGVSVADRALALEYYNILYGDGDLEMDTSTVEAQRSAKLRPAGESAPLNLYENSKLTYSGETPMVGMKYIHSKSFWGGIGAEVMETFQVTEMDREGSTFFASTNPASYLTDTEAIRETLEKSPVHSVGIQTRNAFNGTWETNARMHKLLSKDVKVHEAFTGRFEVEKLLKFHENPVAEPSRRGCDGIDC